MRSPRSGPTLAAFLANGLFFGAWAAVLPSVQQAADLSKGALGLALLFTPLGAIVTMVLVAGPLVDRLGIRALTLTCASFAAATALPGLAASLPVLIATLAAAGAANGAMDVAMNAAAARIETARGVRMMPLAHGLYSIGVLAGAAGAGLARGAGASREAILLATSTVSGLVAVWTATDSGPLARPETRGLRLTRALLAIGLVGAAAFVVEGGTEGWSALFLERRLHAEPSVSGLGPGAFGAAMAAGRLLGQRVKLPDRLLLAGGAVLAASGCVVAASATSAPVALAGFALSGAGISLNAPIVFGAAGRTAARAVASVTTLGYTGLLLGPPLVGGIAQVSSLRTSFLALAVIAAAVAAAAPRLEL